MRLAHGLNYGNLAGAVALFLKRFERLGYRIRIGLKGHMVVISYADSRLRQSRMPAWQIVPFERS